MGPKLKGKSPAADEPSVSDEVYRIKRDRNNVAVKKSREKSRTKARETSEKIAHLREENSELEQRVEDLSSELNLLKKTLLAHVGAGVRRRLPQNSLGPTNCNAKTAPGSDSSFTLADPKTVSRDHEYTGQRAAA